MTFEMKRRGLPALVAALAMALPGAALAQPADGGVRSDGLALQPNVVRGDELNEKQKN